MIEPWQQSLFFIIPLISTGICLLLAVSVWQRRDVPGSICLFGLLLAISQWSLFATFENLAIEINAKLFWAQFQYIGVVSVPVFFLIFSARYSQNDHWLNSKSIALLWAIPVITLGLIASNRLHHWMWISTTTNPVTGNLVYLRGWWFWLHVVYSYLLLFITSVILFRTAYQASYQHRVQIWTVFFAGLIPWIANILYIGGMLPLQNLDPTPFSFSITGILITLSLTKYQLIYNSPIARTKLVDILQDALFAIDQRGNLIDINPAAERLVGIKKKNALGSNSAEIFHLWPTLSTHLQKTDILSITHPKVISDIHNRWYDVQISPLQNPRQQTIGAMVILRDITTQRNAETDLSRLATVVEQASETIVITDLNGKIIYANPFFETISGYSIEEALGKNPNILKSGYQSQAEYKKLWQTITSGNICKGQFVNRHKNGRLFHEAATIFPIKTKSGRITNYAAVKRDISVEIEAEQALQTFVDGLENIYDLSIQMSLVKTFDEMCKMAVEVGSKKLAVDRMSIWMIDATDSDYIVGTYGIDEQGRLRDERQQRLKIVDSPDYIRKLTQKGSFYHQETELRNDQYEIVGRGDLVIMGIWDKNQIIGYLCADNQISQSKITEEQRSILILFSQTLGNLATQKMADEALQGFSKHLEHLHQINLTLSLVDSFDELCKQAIELGRLHLSFDRVELWFLNPNNENELIGAYATAETGEIVDQRAIRLAITPEANFKTFLSGSPRVVHQHNAVLFTPKNSQPIIGELAASALWDGTQIIGYIKVDNLIERKSFSNQQLDLLVLFAQTIGNLSTRLRSSEKIQTNARNQALLNEITRTAISQSEFQEMLQTLADRMGELFNANGCFITLWDKENQKAIPATAYGMYKNSYSQIETTQNDKTFTQYVLEHNQILMVENVQDSPYLSKRLAANFSASSVLVLPLISNDIRLGAALIAYDKAHEFTDQEIEMAETASRQIALAVLKAQLYDEAQKRATEAETLRQASGAIVTTLKRDEAIEKILIELNRVIPYDSASVQLLKGNELEIVGERGFRETSIIGMTFQVNEETPNAIVFQKNQVYIIEDAPMVFEAFKHPPHNHIHGWMGVPLRIQDKTIGMIALDSFTPNRFTQDHARMAQAFADQVAIALENTRLFEETQRLALHDSLTGLYNRRRFMDLARAEFHRAKRYEEPLSAIMLDIDLFKNINDTYGHLIGDQVLQFVAHFSKNHLRINDLIGRYGGEEFVIILPETHLTATSAEEALEPAALVAERLRKGIENAKIETERGKISVTISLGVAELDAKHPNVEKLIDYADQALLIAKQSGRNKTVYWDELNHNQIPFSK